MLTSTYSSMRIDVERRHREHLERGAQRTRQVRRRALADACWFALAVLVGLLGAALFAGALQWWLATR